MATYRVAVVGSTSVTSVQHIMKSVTIVIKWHILHQCCFRNNNKSLVRALFKEEDAEEITSNFWVQ